MAPFDPDLLKRLLLVFEDAGFKFKKGDTVKDKDGKMGRVESSRRSGADLVIVSVGGRGNYNQDDLEFVR